MHSLTPASVDKLFSEFLNQQTPQDRPIFHQFLLDAGGSPRLLDISSKIIRSNENQSIQTLRALLAERDPIPNLHFGALRSPQLRNSYLLALHGWVSTYCDIFEACFQQGFLIMQAPISQIRITPVIPPLSLIHI